jgi:hypothetical protein
VVCFQRWPGGRRFRIEGTIYTTISFLSPQNIRPGKKILNAAGNANSGGMTLFGSGDMTIGGPIQKIGD